MGKELAVMVVAIVFISAGAVAADTVDELTAVQSADQLALLVRGLPRESLTGGGAESAAAADLRRFEETLGLLADEINARKPRAETYGLFRETALKRHRLMEHIANGKIAITEQELETARALFGDLVAYFEGKLTE